MDAKPNSDVAALPADTYTPAAMGQDDDLVLFWENERTRQRVYVPRVPRITISKATTWAWLREQVERRSGDVVVVSGIGARARRLTERLQGIFDDVRLEHRASENRYRAIVGASKRGIFAVKFAKDPVKPAR